MSLLDKKAVVGVGASITKVAKLHQNASTQIDVPSAIAAKIAEIGRKLIPDDVLAGDGREDHLHVTVKYGVRSDENLLRETLGNYPSFTVTLGKVLVFTPSESSGGESPVVVEAHASELGPLHEAVGAAMGTFRDTFPYSPHVTIAYVRTKEANKFTGSDLFSGITFPATAVTLSNLDDHNKVKVPLGKTAAAATYWHVSPTVNRKEIKKRGLVPQTKEFYEVNRPKGIYVFGEKDDAINWAYDFWHGYSEIDRGLDLWQVTLDPAQWEILEDTHPDAQGTGAVYTVKAIPVGRLRLESYLTETEGEQEPSDMDGHREEDDTKSVTAAAPMPARPAKIPRPLFDYEKPEPDEEEVERDQPAVKDFVPEPEEPEEDEWGQERKEPYEAPEPARLPLPVPPKGWRAPKKPAPQTTNFKKWFGKSTVVDDDGKPLKVYHGTTHEIGEFNIEKTNAENFYGQGFYFSDSALDVEKNYATPTGGDITARIQTLAEQIEQQRLDEGGMSEEDMDVLRDEAYEQAKERLLGPHKGATMPVYLSIKNPVVVVKNGGTDFEVVFDEDTEEESATAWSCGRR